MRQLSQFICLCLCAFLATGADCAHAQSPGLSLYAGEVPVTDQSDEQRTEGLKNALAQVVVKLTGDKNVLASESVAKAVAGAERFVQQYQYRQDVATENGQPQIRLVLVAQFDRAPVDRLLRDRGLKVWGSDSRAPLLVWLATDTGNGPRLLADAASSELRDFMRSAQQRGLGIVLPTVADPAQAELAAQTVWNGDTTGLVNAAARYQTDQVLVGQLRQSGGEWTAHWNLLQGGQVATSWDVRDASFATVLAAGAEGAADRIGVRSAAVPEERRISTARIWVSGLNSAQDYARLLEILGHNEWVRDTQAEQARNDGVLLRINLNLALDRWLTYLPPDGALRVVSAQPPVEGVEATLSLAQ
ncbi:MAG: DUF2066 domain-containing protein [Tahibacter sp.]